MAKPVPRLAPQLIQQVVARAWDSRAPYTDLLMSHGLSEGQVVALMRRELKPSVFKLWRERSGSRK